MDQIASLTLRLKSLSRTFRLYTICISGVVVIAISCVAFALANTPLAHTMQHDHLNDEIQVELDLDPVEGYYFVDKEQYQGVLLERTTDAGASYIKETVFVGDSNTSRMEMYGFITLENSLGVESMGIYGAAHDRAIFFSGYSDPVTIPKAIELMKPRRIAICFGTNDIGTNNLEMFIGQYIDFIYAVRSAYPYADIIVCAIPPFGQALEGRRFSITTVREYNLGLIQMCKELGLVFLDTGEALTNTDGFIKPEYIYSDGIHFTETGLDAFFWYARLHSHIVDDARPKEDIKLRNDGRVPRQVYPPRRAEDEFDTGLVTTTALNLLIADGFTGANANTSWNNAQKITWSCSFAKAAESSEEEIGREFYQFILDQSGRTSGALAISSTTDRKAKLFIFICNIANDHEHDWSSWIIVTEAGCETKGLQKRVCQTCEQEEEQEIPALGHDPQETNRINPTCTKSGSYDLKCTRCPKYFGQKIEIPPLGHDFDENGICRRCNESAGSDAFESNKRTTRTTRTRKRKRG